jgi:diguanylate cyclase (GGDEF)-like protein
MEGKQQARKAMAIGPMVDDLAVSVIDALTSHICVIEPSGKIVAVNRAWTQFQEKNAPNLDTIGINYLDICRHSVGVASVEASPVFHGLNAVLRGEREFFQIEYPCHSPSAMQWYLARVSPLRRRSPADQAGNIGAVISHVNITAQKQVEMEYAKLAATDPLTDIPNRRFFLEFAELDMNRSLRFGAPSSLLIVDIDRFKNVNDTYGHAKGDAVIRRVAEVCTNSIRSCDLFARLGGEEFVCILSQIDGQGAFIAAERLRIAVERLSVFSGIRRIPVTVSIGISPITSKDRGVDDVLRRADRALYRAKAEGRNCVRCQDAIVVGRAEGASMAATGG